MTVSKDDKETVYHSKFLRRVDKLPAVQITKSFYETTKRVEVLKCGLELVEKGIVAVSRPVKAAIPIGDEHVRQIDLAANNTLKTLERKFPIVTEYPAQAGERVARKALRTFPGRQFMKGLDLLISVSETALDFVKPVEECRTTVESPIEDVTAKEGVDETDKPSSTDEGVDVDSEPVPVLGIATNIKKPPNQPLIKLVTEVQGFDVAALAKTLYCFTVVWGLDMWVQVLQSIRRYLRRLYTGQYRKSARIRTTTKLSPSKAQAMEARRIRKVTPHKSMEKSTIVEQFRTWMMTFLGKAPELSSSTGSDIRKYLIKLDDSDRTADGETVTDDAEHERKRKFSEVSSESNDVSDVDLATFDLDKYVSEEDPDYEPCSETESEESLEYAESASEDDFVAELQEAPPVKQDEGKLNPEEQKIESEVAIEVASEVVPQTSEKLTMDDALPVGSPPKRHSPKDNESDEKFVHLAPSEKGPYPNLDMTHSMTHMTSPDVSLKPQWISKLFKK